MEDKIESRNRRRGSERPGTRMLYKHTPQFQALKVLRKHRKRTVRDAERAISYGAIDWDLGLCVRIRVRAQEH